MTVVKFPETEDKIWICNCGCSTYHFHKDGTVECASCSAVGPSGEWQVGQEIKRDGDYVHTITQSDEEFLFRRFIQEVDKENVMAAALFREDGSQRTVYRDNALPENDAVRRWWRRRARRMLKDLDSDWKRAPKKG